MNERLSLERLAAMDTRAAVLSAGRYALPVRFRIREGTVECRVPTWSGVGDLLNEPGEVCLVTYADSGRHLSWFFLRGRAALVPAPDWDGLSPLHSGPATPDDLYQVVRITPVRMERVDEQRGWGFRETIDL